MEQVLINVVQGDADYFLNFTLTDAAGVVVNLTGATLTFNAQSVADPSASFAGSMSVVSAAAGTCYYQVQGTDFAQPGNWNAQIVALYSGTGEKITFADILVSVEARIPIDE